jgi:hypothetical protein
MTDKQTGSVFISRPLVSLTSEFLQLLACAAAGSFIFD